MPELLLGVAPAFLLGLQTSISPCPLATNIAAISFIGKRVDRPGTVLLSGILYTAGRTAAYVALAILLVSTLLSAPYVSHFLGRYMNKLLGPILGIEDPRTDARIDFVGGSRGIGGIEKRCRDDMRLGFALHPLGVMQLMDTADRGETLPPKSTWFEPKLRSGMVVNLLTE